MIIQTRLPNSIISLLQILQTELVNLLKMVKAAKPNPWIRDYIISIEGKVGTEWQSVKKVEKYGKGLFADTKESEN